MVKHANNGDCLKCEEIFNRYEGFHEGLKKWFKNLQKNFPEAHISCAGRGRKEQQEAYDTQRSNALYGQSAHNYNAAIDVFRLKDGKYDLGKIWFMKAVGGYITVEFNWYGAPNSRFYELPHIEVREWKKLRDLKKLNLVE